MGRCAGEVQCSAVSEEVGDGDPCSSKGTRIIDVLETVEVPENGHVGIRASSPKKVVGTIAQLKCICTSAHGMHDRQEKLEATVQLEKYGTVAMRETWWDDSLSWRDREQNEVPVIRGEMVSDLLCHLGQHKSLGPDGAIES